MAKNSPPILLPNFFFTLIKTSQLFSVYAVHYVINLNFDDHRSTLSRIERRIFSPSTMILPFIILFGAIFPAYSISTENSSLPVVMWHGMGSYNIEILWFSFHQVGRFIRDQYWKLLFHKSNHKSSVHIIPSKYPKISIEIYIWYFVPLTGDSCCNPLSMGRIQRIIEENVPGIYVKSIQIGSNMLEVMSSFSKTKVESSSFKL